MNPGSKPNETIYTYCEQELHALLAKLTKAGKRWQEPIQRYKGLGEMDADQLATTTMDRAGRLLRRVRMEDAEAAGRVFELLMGNEVAPRREFIIESSDRLSREASTPRPDDPAQGRHVRRACRRSSRSRASSG